MLNRAMISVAVSFPAFAQATVEEAQAEILSGVVAVGGGFIAISVAVALIRYLKRLIAS